MEMKDRENSDKYMEIERYKLMYKRIKGVINVLFTILKTSQQELEWQSDHAGSNAGLKILVYTALVIKF